ncbi:MAG: aldehyde dehydrogenase family protein, partial [Gammaproteobacteria bacterium]|nr:aldehyde dehydrogenase family protein [Gammaproteobacteria bacterium]
MPHISLNPATGKVEGIFQRCNDQQLDNALEEGMEAQKIWQMTDLVQRAEALRRVSEILRKNHDDYAALITREMGKPLREARSEVGKCALACDY